MSDTRNARERLEALLTGLEDEVMRGEGCVDTDVTGMRAEMEALIGKHLGATGRAEAAASGAGDARGKVADAVERLGRWAGAGQSAMRAALGPRVRMAFSGERESSEGGRRRDVGRAGRSPKGEKHDKGR